VVCVSARDGNGTVLVRLYDRVGRGAAVDSYADKITTRKSGVSLCGGFLGRGMEMQRISEALKLTVIVECGRSFVLKG
jgi:hypothetical protein